MRTMLCKPSADATGRWAHFLVGCGEIGTVRGWLDALPRECFGADPRLSVAYAWCLGLAGETDGLVRWLNDAEAALGDRPDLDPVAVAGVRIQVALIRSRGADLLGDAETALQQVRLARELLPLLPPTTGASLRGIASAFIANALRRAGDLAGAEEAYRAALPDLRVGANPTAVAGRSPTLLGSRSPAALRTCEEELDRRGAGAAATASGALWAAVARARLELGDLGAAELAARRAVAPVFGHLDRLHEPRVHGRGVPSRSPCATLWGMPTLFDIRTPTAIMQKNFDIQP